MEITEEISERKRLPKNLAPKRILMCIGVINNKGSVPLHRSLLISPIDEKHRQDHNVAKITPKTTIPVIDSPNFFLNISIIRIVFRKGFMSSVNLNIGRAKELVAWTLIVEISILKLSIFPPLY